MSTIKSWREVENHPDPGVRFRAMLDEIDELRAAVYAQEAKIDALQTHLARCRDAFQIPTPDLGRLGDPWCAAMASPDAIPAFVEQSIKQLEADAERYRVLKEEMFYDGWFPGYWNGRGKGRRHDCGGEEMTTEHEQLELAAKACGIEFNPTVKHKQGLLVCRPDAKCQSDQVLWNPLHSDGDCARMEAALNIGTEWYETFVQSATYGDHVIVIGEGYADHNGDKSAARRAASVAVAAEIGGMK